MKRLPLILFALCWVKIYAQVPYYPNLDTIECHGPNYYTYDWYDNLPEYHADTAKFYAGQFYSTEPKIWAKEDYTASRLEIKGVVGMVILNPADYNWYYSSWVNWTRHPEYFYVLKKDYSYTPAKVQILDSVRWDTIVPHIMRIPLRAHSDTLDSADYAYCYAYEAYFKEPVHVDSHYYLAGSLYSNDYGYHGPDSINSPMCFLYIPTMYTT
ncbi:MAG: hypothetical protein MJZ18_11510, partial [Bacteroidales bacterium]|nr:hypothetical protein [Bacteroidales bacterium]